MPDLKKTLLEKFTIETATKIYCLNAKCVNLVPEDCCCNLKRVVINPRGKCAGEVKMDPDKTKKTKKTEKAKKK